MDFDFRTEGGGYVVTVTGEYDDAGLTEMGERVRTERPSGGFDFGVFDLLQATITSITGWELSQETAERLHPVARLIQQDVAPGFRIAVVSRQPEMDQVLADLLSVAEFGATAAPGSVRAVIARHDTLADALAWGRAGAAAQQGTTVRE